MKASFATDLSGCVESLEAGLRLLRSAVGPIQATVGGLALGDRVTELMERTIRQQIDMCFESLHDGVKKRLSRIKDGVCSPGDAASVPSSEADAPDANLGSDDVISFSNGVVSDVKSALSLVSPILSAGRSLLPVRPVLVATHIAPPCLGYHVSSSLQFNFIHIARRTCRCRFLPSSMAESIISSNF